MKKIIALIITLMIMISSISTAFATEMTENNIRKLGDVNEDSKIDINDVTHIQRHLARFITFNNETSLIADVDGDGRVAIMDATWLQMYLADLVNYFPANKTEPTIPTETETTTVTEITIPTSSETDTTVSSVTTEPTESSSVVESSSSTNVVDTTPTETDPTETETTTSKPVTDPTEEPTETTEPTEEVILLESPHPYSYNYNKSWTIKEDGATSISITFNSKTLTQKNHDFIYIIRRDGSYHGVYSGAELASKTITIEGDKVILRLITDSIANAYGFAITKIEYDYTPTEPTEPTQPTTWPDLTNKPENVSEVITDEVLQKIEEGFLKLVNEERKSLGLCELKPDAPLDEYAQIRSKEIIEKFSHTRPNGEGCLDELMDIQGKYLKLGYCRFGENIVYGNHLYGGTYDTNVNPFIANEQQIKDVCTNLFKLFKNSPGHYANMIDNDWTLTGIGISYKIEYNIDKEYGLPYFYLAQIFSYK